MLAMSVAAFLQIIAVCIGIVVGVGGLAATIWAIGKVRGVEASIGVLNAANEGLRLANEDLRLEMTRSERQCAERVAKLEGQNQALLDGLGDKLAVAIAVRLEHTLETAATRIVDGIARRSEERERRFTDGTTPPAGIPAID